MQTKTFNKKLSTFLFNKLLLLFIVKSISKKRTKKDIKKITKKIKITIAQAKQKTKRKHILNKNLDRFDSRLMQY